jgi:hypothetical protein
MAQRSFLKLHSCGIVATFNDKAVRSQKRRMGFLSG